MERDTEFLQEMPSLRRESVAYPQHIRQNFLYICGKIGLTLWFLLVPFFNALDEVGKLEQISHAKGGTTGGKDHAGIKRSKAGPGSGENPHVISSLVKADAIFSPAVAIVEDLKLLPVQGMEGMGDGENSFL